MKPKNSPLFHGSENKAEFEEEMQEVLRGSLYEMLKKMVNLLYFIVQKQKKTGKFRLKYL